MEEPVWPPVSLVLKKKKKKMKIVLGFLFGWGFFYIYIYGGFVALTQFPENPASSCQGLSECTSQPSAVGERRRRSQGGREESLCQTGLTRM